MRRLIAVALALSLLTSGMAGCSQPIDTGSTVPAQSQPIVALLALVAVGIGLTAWHHHNEAHHGSGPGSAIVPPAQVFKPLLSGYRATDLAIDTTGSGIGVLESPTVSGTSAIFALIVNQTYTPYTLPTGYIPLAVAIDPSSNDWFVDQTGHVQGCEPPGTGITTCTFNLISFATANDGLGTGQRSIAVDQFNLVSIRDGGGGKVDWFAFNLSTGATATGSYQSTSTNGLYSTDAVESTSPGGGVSGFAVFHTDGVSDLLTLAPPANSPNFTFIPSALTAPSDQMAAPDGLGSAFYGTTGSASGTYRLTRYENANPTGIGQLATTSVTIAVNGQTGDPSNKPYVLPLTSVHADPLNNVWALDSNASGVDIVQFGQF